MNHTRILEHHRPLLARAAAHKQLAGPMWELAAGRWQKAVHHLIVDLAEADHPNVRQATASLAAEVLVDELLIGRVLTGRAAAALTVRVWHALLRAGYAAPHPKKETA